jgi:zinc protease
MGTLRRVGGICAAVLAAGLAHAARAAELPDRSPGAAAIERLRFPPLELRVPKVGAEVARQVLPNGLVVYLQADRSLALVQATLSVRGGSLHLPADRPGIAALLGSQLRAGGTTRLDADALNEELETMGASLETALGGEAATATLEVLGKDLERGLALLADVVQRPAFAERKLALAKATLKESLRRSTDQPRAILERELARALYGAGHPFGARLTPGQVDAVTRADLLAWHAALLAPSRAMLAVAGAFEPAGLVAALRREFGGWAGAAALPPTAPSPPAPGRAVILVEKPLAQSSVAMAHFGLRWGDPDQPAAELMNAILGGSGLTSRITGRVRAEEGLAYAAGSTLAFGSLDPGAFRAYVQTRPAATRRAIDLMLEEIRRIRDHGVTEAEVAGARESVINSLVFAFAAPGASVARLMRLELSGLPADYYEGLVDRYRAVTRSDVQRIARRLLDPDRLVIVVVGDPARFDRPLDDLGPVTRLRFPPATP